MPSYFYFDVATGWQISEVIDLLMYTLAFLPGLAKHDFKIRKQLQLFLSRDKITKQFGRCCVALFFIWSKMQPVADIPGYLIQVRPEKSSILFRASHECKVQSECATTVAGNCRGVCPKVALNSMLLSTFTVPAR